CHLADLARCGRAAAQRERGRRRGRRRRRARRGRAALPHRCRRRARRHGRAGGADARGGGGADRRGHRAGRDGGQAGCGRRRALRGRAIRSHRSAGHPGRHRDRDHAGPGSRGGRVSALLSVYRPAEPVFVAGRGAFLVAEDGREYLDFASGIGVNALGYGDADITRAIAAAADTGLLHTSNLYRTRPAAEPAAALVRLSFADAVFFCNSGAEANEAAFKFARRWARQAAQDKVEIVALGGSFHGRLFGSLAATDRPAFRAPFEPLMPGVRFVPPGDVDALRAAVSRARTAAIIVEPVQGEGGVRPLDAEYLHALRAVADEADALLIFDEVQCGLGRTGRLFAYEESGVAPDLLTLAKPLAGGLPMGAVLLSARVAAAIQPGDH